MADRKTKKDPQELEKIRQSMLAEQQQRQTGYREQALKLFPWVCARCSREFEGKRVRELTVHHKDHNHDNNPPDGSNWELLCLYCHDHEHSRALQKDGLETFTEGKQQEASLVHSPFAGLANKLGKNLRD